MDMRRESHSSRCVGLLLLLAFFFLGVTWGERDFSPNERSGSAAIDCGAPRKVPALCVRQSEINAALGAPRLPGRLPNVPPPGFYTTGPRVRLLVISSVERFDRTERGCAPSVAWRRHVPRTDAGEPPEHERSRS